MPDTLSNRQPPLLAGIAIIAGTAVGAGMFSLPLVSSGMWFGWSTLLMLITWFCMLHSGLMILECNLNFEPGSSFDTFVGQTLGRRWNAINGISLAFVLYILTYAYISGGGSIVSHTLEGLFDYTPPAFLASLLFAMGLASIVWFSTGLVGRLTTVLIAGMAITFVLSVAGIAPGVETELLLTSQPEYALYLFAAVPYFLTSFGYHGCVPSLMKYYGRNPRRIQLCLVIGSLFSLCVYLLWQAVVFGNIPRHDFHAINAAGGNVGDLVGALGAVVDSERLSSLLNSFANLAVISSFLGVTLGLFDFIADKFGFDDSRMGRTRTALVTFVPPAIGGVFFPDGFLYAIGLAGLTAALWGTSIPAMCARKSREKYGNPRYRVWGGDGMILLLYGYSVLLVACFLLAAINVLPVY